MVRIILRQCECEGAAEGGCEDEKHRLNLSVERVQCVFGMGKGKGKGKR